MDGAMMEIGPYRVREGGKLEYSPGSWDEFANVLFVDNPVGTGFSYVDTNSYLHELKEMADQFVVFLEKWFALFPEYEHDDVSKDPPGGSQLKTDDPQLYFAGESYAGQHIPYIARAVLDRNKDTTKRPWDLKGLLIGNGWTSPVDQSPSYLQYAYKSGLIKADSDQAKQLEAQQAVCNKKLTEGGKDHIETLECEEILQEILRLTVDKSAPKDAQCVNMYDVRLRDSFPSCGMNWPSDLATVTPYLRRKDVVNALHVNPDKSNGWTECSGAVSGAFRARNSRPAVELLPGILTQVPIVLFSGDQDLICNHVGTEELIHNMAWNGGQGFELSPGTWAPRRQWTFEGEPAGIYQEARNLTYVVFYNSSHMVPYDYPRRTRDMLDRFMGVDIASIGGKPTNSRIDGEKAGLETSVGGHPNSTVAEEAEKDKLQQATWNAYYKSGEVVLVIVIIAAGLWGWYIWRDRQRRAGYRNMSAGGAALGMLDGMRGGMNMSRGTAHGHDLEDFRHKEQRDLEAADFDAAELDEMDPRARRDRQGQGERPGQQPERRYSLGSASSEEDEPGRGRGKGQ